MQSSTEGENNWWRLRPLLQVLQYAFRYLATGCPAFKILDCELSFSDAADEIFYIQQQLNC